MEIGEADERQVGQLLDAEIPRPPVRVELPAEAVQALELEDAVGREEHSPDEAARHRDVRDPARRSRSAHRSSATARSRRAPSPRRASRRRGTRSGRWACRAAAASSRATSRRPRATAQGGGSRRPPPLPTARSRTSCRARTGRPSPSRSRALPGCRATSPTPHRACARNAGIDVVGRDDAKAISGLRQSRHRLPAPCGSTGPRARTRPGTSIASSPIAIARMPRRS